MQRGSASFPVHRHFVHWRLLRRIDHALRHAVLQRLLNDSRIVPDRGTRPVDAGTDLFVFRTGGAFTHRRQGRAKYAKITDTAHAGFPSKRSADRLRYAGSRRCTSDLPLFQLKYLLVRATGDATSASRGTCPVDQSTMPSFTLVDSNCRAGRHARRLRQCRNVGAAG